MEGFNLEPHTIYERYHQYIHKHCQNYRGFHYLEYEARAIHMPRIFLFLQHRIALHLLQNAVRRLTLSQALLSRNRNLQYNYQLLFSVKIGRDRFEENHTKDVFLLSSYFFLVSVHYRSVSDCACISQNPSVTATPCHFPLTREAFLPDFQVCVQFVFLARRSVSGIRKLPCQKCKMCVQSEIRCGNPR